MIHKFAIVLNNVSEKHLRLRSFAPYTYLCKSLFTLEFSRFLKRFKERCLDNDDNKLAV
jgi:hypothetical protein